MAQGSGNVEGGTCGALEVDASSSSKVEVTLTGGRKRNGEFVFEA